ncbi:hypothetical protein [Pseudomonas fluorescens]|nr:hypothetical protein [Pseudomonas fluorescens]
MKKDFSMHLLNTYCSQDEAEEAVALLKGPTRVASERDDTDTIYNLFAEATWANLHSLEMYDLPELKALLMDRASWGQIQIQRHQEILRGLERVSKKYDLKLPAHWQ